MRYDLCGFAYLWKRGKMGCFERLISAVCWWLTAHFFVTISQRTHFFVFWGRDRFASPQHPCNFNERVSLIIPLLFSLLAFSFRFLFSTVEQKNIFEFGQYSYEAYVLVSGLFFTLAFGSSLCHAELVSASHCEPIFTPFTRWDPELNSGWHDA